MDVARITAMYDEGAETGTSYIGATGFSLLVEADGKRTLFGTGRRERYLSNNMYVADLDAGTIGQVVVSHGHPDHWGALPAIIRSRSEDLDLYAPVSAWGTKRILGSTGMNFKEETMRGIVRRDVTDWTQLSEHLYITAPVKFHKGDAEEVFLVLSTRNGPVLMSGCCHCGLDNVFEIVKSRFGRYPCSVIGGLHLGGKKDRLADLYAEYLKSKGCGKLYLNHCTGIAGIGRLRATLGLSNISDLYVGQSVEFRIF